MTQAPPPQPERPLALELRGISKQFPLVLANDNISMSVRWGEVHALVGENGAGKSTLMKIIYGVQPPSSGEMFYNGQAVNFSDPREAIRLGIGMVFQHFMLVPPLTVTENVILGEEPGSPFALNYPAARRRVAELIERFGFGMSPDDRIEDLPLGLQQKVEILKTLYRGAKLLILDEPTAVLTPAETEELFAFLKGQYAAEGNAVIFISHKLNEVLAISDQISVIRDGRMVGTVPAQGTSTEDLARMMVGREVTLKVNKAEAQPQAAALEVRGVTVPGEGRSKNLVDGVSFTVRAGEIVGIAGIEGNGQSQLVEVITGLRRQGAGEVLYLGQNLGRHPTPAQVSAAGVSHIPEDRNLRGLVLDMTTAENLILGRQHGPPFSGALGFLNGPAIMENAAQKIEEYDVRPRSVSLPAGSYSGGNAQKIIVAREMSKNPRVLIASQPTRGVDIGAIEFIHSTIVAARDQGLAVLLISADLAEVMNLSDRILVMFEGRIVGEMPAREATDTALGLLMAGTTDERQLREAQRTGDHAPPVV